MERYFLCVLELSHKCRARTKELMDLAEILVKYSLKRAKSEPESYFSKELNFCRHFCPDNMEKFLYWKIKIFPYWKSVSRWVSV